MRTLSIPRRQERSTKWLLPCVVLLALATLPRSSAQWSSDPNVNTPICRASGDQQVPTIVGDGAGGAVVTWQDTRTTILPNIYAQQLNATGYIHWQLDGVAVSVGQTMKMFPRIVSDRVRGTIITWIDSPPQPNLDWDIYTQRIDTSGITLWTMNGVPVCSLPRDQILGSACADDSGGVFVTWHDLRNFSTTIYDIYAQRINQSGTIQWSLNGKAISTAPQSQQYPEVVADGTGGAIITWEDDRTALGKDIYAQRISPRGTTRWTANGVAISTASDQQELPQIIGDGGSGAIIIWRDSRLSPCRLYAQRVDSTGNSGSKRRRGHAIYLF